MQRRIKQGGENKNAIDITAQGNLLERMSSHAYPCNTLTRALCFLLLFLDKYEIYAFCTLCVVRSAYETRDTEDALRRGAHCGPGICPPKNLLWRPVRKRALLGAGQGIVRFPCCFPGRRGRLTHKNSNRYKINKKDRRPKECGSKRGSGHMGFAGLLARLCTM